MAAKIKKGDKVIVLTGRDKGRSAVETVREAGAGLVAGAAAVASGIAGAVSAGVAAVTGSGSETPPESGA